MALALDELELISKKLTFAPDYTRFRSICKAWRSAAPKHAQLPWLIATSVNCTKFYQFCFKDNKFTQIPELSGPALLSSSFLDKEHVFIRSSRGWLFLLNLHTKSGSLFNPLTGSRINLPKLRFVKYSNCKYDIQSHKFGFGLTSDPGESLPECFAVVYHSGRIFYCKVGSTGWREMQHPEICNRDHIHICCYRGKLFLALSAGVFVCEFSDNPRICKLISLGLSRLRFLDTYLVESDGDLLLVLVFDIGYSTCKVFKLEFGQQQVKLVDIKCLGDRSLFMGLDTTFSLVASKYTGCKQNSIYIPEFSGRFDKPTIAPGLIIYDCEEEQPRCAPDLDEGPAHLIPCAWFRPSLLM